MDSSDTSDGFLPIERRGNTITQQQKPYKTPQNMKFTLIRRDQKNQMHLSMKSAESLMERIKTDTKSEDVGGLRQHLAFGGSADSYAQLHRLPVICPSAELTRDANGNLCLRKMNGIVVLSIRNLHTLEAQQRVKQTAMSMPTTLAAFTGSSGQSVKLLVSVALPGGAPLPDSQPDADRFLKQAFSLVRTPYEALLGTTVDQTDATVVTGFRLTLDPQPLYNPQATPFVVSTTAVPPTPPSTADEQQQTDYDLYAHYENLYRQAANAVWSQLPDDADAEGILAETARQLCLAGLPEGEAVVHLWAHYKYRSEPVVSEEHVRAVVGAVYAENKPDRRQTTSADKVGREMRELIDYLHTHYVFRYNTVMGYTEYRPNNTWMQKWQPVDERVANGLTTDARLAGINVWDIDMKRFVKSDKIRPYNPIDDYLWKVHDKWDGHDHIGRLAATVPNDNPHWQRWFRIWFLAMVAQWRGLNRRYGNSVAPLLVSSQGFNKSTFCRSLLPDELQWGYTDNLSLSEKRLVLQAMSQMLLVNLDEFNQISAHTQQGFLKNVIQLARVKAKRPYGHHVEDFPRLASFIATTNIADVLADPSGNRRFIGVELTGPIDVSLRPNHQQLYAQAQALLEQGEPYWFDEHETQLLMRHNRQFQYKSPAEQFFGELFEPTDNPDRGQWLTAAAIYQRLKHTVGSTLGNTSLVAFGRMLANLDDLQRRRSRNGTEYLVAER